MCDLSVIMITFVLDGESSSSQNSPRENKEKSKDSGNKDKVDNDSKPLLNKNTIIGMLSELVKSYSGVAQLIAEYEVQKPLNQVRSQVGNQQLNVLMYKSAINRLVMRPG